jgi:hypothetical protein
LYPVLQWGIRGWLWAPPTTEKKAELDVGVHLLIAVFLTPTANNVMVMVELSGSGAREAIARTIAWQYAVAPIILSVTMTVAVGITNKWSSECCSSLPTLAFTCWWVELCRPKLCSIQQVGPML